MPRSEIAGQRVVEFWPLLPRSTKTPYEFFVVGQLAAPEARRPIAHERPPFGRFGMGAGKVGAQVALLQPDRSSELEAIHLVEHFVGRPAIVFQPKQGGERSRAMPSTLAMNGDGPIGRVVDELEKLFELPGGEPGPTLFDPHRPLH